MFKQLVKDDAGQDLIEYALLAALLAVALVGTLEALSAPVTNIFNGIIDALLSAAA
jgi:pilus assembly protein Flp/PilA